MRGTFVSNSADVIVLPEASTVLGCRLTFVCGTADDFDIDPADGMMLSHHRLDHRLEHNYGYCSFGRRRSALQRTSVLRLFLRPLALTSGFRRHAERHLDRR